MDNTFREDLIDGLRDDVCDLLDKAFKEMLMEHLTRIATDMAPFEVSTEAEAETGLDDLDERMRRLVKLVLDGDEVVRRLLEIFGD